MSRKDEILKRAQALKEARAADRKKKATRVFILFMCVVLFVGLLLSMREPGREQSTAQNSKTFCEDFPTTVAHAEKMIPLLTREGAQFRFTRTEDVYVNRYTTAWMAYWDYASIQEKEHRTFVLAAYNLCVHRPVYNSEDWSINLRDHHTGAVFAKRSFLSGFKLVE